MEWSKVSIDWNFGLFHYSKSLEVASRFPTDFISIPRAQHNEAQLRGCGKLLCAREHEYEISNSDANLIELFDHGLKVSPEIWK